MAAIRGRRLQDAVPRTQPRYNSCRPVHHDMRRTGSVPGTAPELQSTSRASQPQTSGESDSMLFGLNTCLSITNTSPQWHCQHIEKIFVPQTKNPAAEGQLSTASLCRTGAQSCLHLRQLLVIEAAGPSRTLTFGQAGQSFGFE